MNKKWVNEAELMGKEKKSIFTRRVDQVDQETLLGRIALLRVGDESQILFAELKVHRDSSRLDGDATLLLVLASVGETHLASLGSGNDTGLADKRVRQCRLAVIHVSDDGHVTNVLLLVHHDADFVNCEVHLFIIEKEKKLECKFMAVTDVTSNWNHCNTKLTVVQQYICSLFYRWTETCKEG